MPIFTAIGTAVAVGLGATTALGTAGAVAGGSALILGGSGLALTAAGSFIAGATAFGLQVVAGIGLNLLAQQIAGQPQTPAAAAAVSAGVQGTLRAAGNVPRSFPLGWRVTAGSLVYVGTWGKTSVGGNKTPNAFLTQVIALSDVPLRAGDEGLVGLWVNGERVTIEWDNYDSADSGRGYPVTEYHTDDKDYLWVRFHDGTQTAADAFCVAQFGAHPDRPYQSTRVGVGVAYAVVTARVKPELWSGFPEFKFELSGIPLYDISKDTTAGGSGPHRFDTPSTWGGDGDDYPATQIYALLRGITYGGDWLYGLQAMVGARMPAANWIAQIEKCRAAVDAPGGGVEATYRSSVEVLVNGELAALTEQLLTACQGRLAEVGGFYKMYCGAPDAPVMSLTDDDIISTEEQTFTPFFGLSDTINGITGTYPEPDEGWNSKAAPPIYRSDLEELAGDRRLIADVALATVPYARQVQQLMREALQEGQRARRHTFVLPPKFWPLEPGDIVAWTSERNGYEDKQFRVDGVIDKANLDVIVDLTEVDPADYDWDTATHYDAPTIGSTVVVRPPAQAIIDFAAVANEVTGDTPGVARPGILLSWNTDDLDDVKGIQFEVRRDSDNEVIIRGRSDDPDAGAMQIEGNGLLPSTAYEVRGRYIPIGSRDTDWSGWIAVTTTATRFTFPEFAFAEFELLTAHYQREIARIREHIQTLGAGGAEQDAQNYFDRKESRRLLESVNTTLNARITASVEEVMTVITTNEAAFAQFQIDVQAAYEGYADSAVSTGISAFASGYASLAEYNTTLQATVTGGLSAKVTEHISALATLDGYAAARHAVDLDVNGYVVGTELFNGGAGESAFRVSVDYFQVAKPGVSGGSPTTVFEIGTVSGAAAIAIKGSLIADGAVIARSIATDAVTANKIQAGAITTSKLDAGAVTAEKIAAGAITAEKITAGTITATEINSDYVIYNKAAVLGSITSINSATPVTLATITYTSNKTYVLVSAAITFTNSGASDAEGGKSLSVYVEVDQGGVLTTQYILNAVSAQPSSLAPNTYQVQFMFPIAAATSTTVSLKGVRNSGNAVYRAAVGSFALILEPRGVA